MSKNKINRRNFLKFLGIAGAAGAVAGAGMIMPEGVLPESTKRTLLARAEGSKGSQKYEIKPGEYDTYYGFWSGGHSGEVRVLGIPSMREIKRIPVFNIECGSGWGITNESKKLLKGLIVGDTHHVHGSYRNGTYDGKYLWVNDKANNRLARIRIDYMEVDSIITIPNTQGMHGTFPQRHPKTEWIAINSEFQSPIPNRTGVPPKEYYGAHTIVDAERMAVICQVMVEENLDLAATDYQGKYSFATSYNIEQGVVISEMLAADHDYLLVFNW
ncbi:MAG: twin-arginine translocation signal domain-containing protein, partial [Nitrospirota bacterium]